MKTHTVLLTILALAISPVALAQATTNLDSLVTLTFQLPNVRSDIEKALQKTGLSEKNVLCTANQLGEEFGPLKGSFIGPYFCDFGPSHNKLVLEVKTVVVVGTAQYNPAQNKERLVSVIAQTPADKIFLYETLLNARWVHP
jgi:hypothetical protein